MSCCQRLILWTMLSWNRGLPLKLPLPGMRFHFKAGAEAEVRVERVLGVELELAVAIVLSLLLFSKLPAGSLALLPSISFLFITALSSGAVSIRYPTSP